MGEGVAGIYFLYKTVTDRPECPMTNEGGSHSKNSKKSNLWDCFILISCLYLERIEVNLVQKLLCFPIKEIIDELTPCTLRLIYAASIGEGETQK